MQNHFILNAMRILKLLNISILFASLSVFSQELPKSINKRLTEYPDLTQYQASCESLFKCHDFTQENIKYTNKDFYTHVKAYKLNISKDQLFDALETNHPKNLWNGNADFQLMYRPSTKEEFRKNVNGLRIEIGDIIFLELIPKLGPIKAKMPVSFKIVEMNRDEGVLAFSYTTTNTSKGIQHLSVHALDENHVSVIHTSRYLSGSKFRDQKLYAPFHEQFTDGFYINLEELILQP